MILLLPAFKPQTSRSTYLSKLERGFETLTVFYIFGRFSELLLQNGNKFLGTKKTNDFEKPMKGLTFEE